jgi:PhnB protein
MSTGTPPGWHSVTPRLVVNDPARLVGFLKQAFGGQGDYTEERPSQIRIGDSIVMVSGAEARIPMPAFLYVYVADADAVYRRALDAGAVSMEEPADLFYGDRRAMIQDPFGNIWQIATYQAS